MLPSGSPRARINHQVERGAHAARPVFIGQNFSAHRRAISIRPHVSLSVGACGGCDYDPCATFDCCRYGLEGNEPGDQARDGQVA